MARDPGSLKPRRRGVAAALESARAVAPGLALALAATLQAALFPRALVARQVADTARQADSVPQAAAQEADSAAEADSTRLRVLERLERLARPPGYDSVLYALDSARLADAEAGRRPVSSMDSVAATLARMPGYTLTEYEGGTARFQAADRVLQLEAAEGARAAVSQEGMRVEADTAISFDQTTGILRMVGNATLTPPEGDPVESPNMVYDVDEARGTALDARTSYAQGGARWLVRGDMPYAAQDSSYLSHARFTSCDLEVPHYHFETDQIKIVGGNVLVARGVRLYFADVPVFWLPFVAQSLSSGRRSGLLTPRFSVNDIVRTSGGYRRRVSNVGFYWAMSDYSDALVALDWFSETFTSVTGQIQYRWARQFLDGNLSMRHYWQADGGKQLALDTRHAWQIDERTNLRLSARYARDNDFVRDFSFNPREVTQSIDSEGGIDRRFGWGALSVSANRRQFLSDDRTEWTLPAVNLSLTPITLFRSDAEDPHFWNNMTWSGSSGFRRSTLDQAQAAGEAFSFGRADTETRNAFVRSNLSMGNLTLSQSADVTENLTMGVPEALLLPGDSANPADLVTGAPARDIAEARLNWSASVSYQQQLIGSTTLTPRVSITGSMLRADTSSLAQDFVAAPSRISVGAGLKTDIYGFFPGFGGFEAIRHKISPSFDWQWSPATSPSALQQQVFGSRALQPRNTLAVTLNQTFEAKREADPADTAAAAAAADTATAGGPRRIPRAEIISLLALRTSVVRYDFVQADSGGSFLHGFETTRLTNQISSDLLRGLSISMDHDLFDDRRLEDGTLERRFDPHLAQVNLSFSLGSSSPLIRWLGFLGGGGDDEPAEEPLAPDEDPFGGDPLDPFGLPGATDESTIVPGTGEGQTPRGPRAGGAGAWTASFSYSLQRPRDGSRPASQMLSATLRLQPTPNWELSWRTAYDIEAGSFNDHSIRLTRDLHRWQAHFDFLQTATGNWSFRFEVSLMDNRDLRFDYDQQNLDLQREDGS